MSFTSNMKNEISNIRYSESESRAELSAILNIAGIINSDSFSIYLENVSVARRIYKLIKDIYHVEIEMDNNEINTLRKNKLVKLTVREKCELILNDLCIVSEEKRIYEPKQYLVDEEKDKQAYLRGVFMICGSISDPKISGYHAEFVIDNEKTANYVNDLFNELSFNSKVIKREKSYMIYLKRSEKISDFIKLLNALTSLFYYEDIRIYRDSKNMTNRSNNCEQANVDKSMAASNEQLKMISFLKEIKDFDLLDEKIKDVCVYKEKYPETSMEELSEIISLETGRTITKSGINHRFRKIKKMIDLN